LQDICNANRDLDPRGIAQAVEALREEEEANRPRLPQPQQLPTTHGTPPALAPPATTAFQVDSLFDDALIFPEVDEQVPPANPRPSLLNVPAPAN